LFNHPGTVASDGSRLLLADRNNNRVLIWNTLPTQNTPPDLVLGQRDFTANDPGTALDQMNWPVCVSTANGKVVVADTENDRILIWNSFPTRNGQRADLVLRNGPTGPQYNQKRSISWPWGVWTDGKKLVVSSTQAGLVLIWNSLPTQDDQPANIYLSGQGDLGTPRTITSDGNRLIVGEHNRKRAFGRSAQGNYFWKSWPKNDDVAYDFFMPEPFGYGWTQGDFAQDGKLVMLGEKLYIWNSFPESADDSPDLSVGTGRWLFGGDGSAAEVISNRLYISLSNGNKIVGFNSVPTTTNAEPNFSVGSPDIYTNTLETNFIISNPNPVTDGNSLFVSSDFDKKLYVWKKLPHRSGTKPDFVYSLFDQTVPTRQEPWDNELFQTTLVLAGQERVCIWNRLPLSGERTDRVFDNSIGNVAFQDLKGVALDSKYFYLADYGANKIYVWEGIPSQTSNPRFSIDANQPGRLSSDGTYLVVAAGFPDSPLYLRVYRIADLSSPNPQPIVLGDGTFSLPQGAIVSRGHLFVGDTLNNRVLIWKKIEDAIAGGGADVILGANDLADVNPEIGRNKRFMPANLAFDGSYLWVGEFKFSERILRFSVGFDFSLSNSGAITVRQAGSGSNTITATLISASTQTVSLSVSGLPVGATASFAPVSSNRTFTSTCSITASASTPVGSYVINVTGSGGGLTRSTTFTLAVSPGSFVKDVGTVILSASKNAVWFVKTGNIYDDSALGFFYSKCVNPQNIILQTDSSKINQTTGRPILTGNLVTFGGRGANKITKYYEDQGLATVRFSMNSTHYMFMKGSTVVYAAAISTYNYNSADYFVMQVLQDGSRMVFLIWGIAQTGTYASGICFADTVYPNLTSYNQSYYIFKWTDLDGNGIQTSNEITQIASGS